MAVAWVSPSAESHTGTTGSTNQASFSWTITPSAAPRWAVVFVMNATSTTDQVTSVTYNGVTMNAIAGGRAIDSAGEAGSCKAYFLDNIPANTTQRTIVVNRNNNANVLYGACIVGSAAGACDVVGVTLIQGDGTLAEVNIDDGSPGTNSLRVGGMFTGLASPPAAGANSTTMAAIDFGNLGASTVRETTPGQGSRPVGWSSGTSDDRAAVLFAVRETPSGTNVTASVSTQHLALSQKAVAASAGVGAAVNKQALTFSQKVVTVRADRINPVSTQHLALSQKSVTARAEQPAPVLTQHLALSQKTVGVRADVGAAVSTQHLVLGQQAVTASSLTPAPVSTQHLSLAQYAASATGAAVAVVNTQHLVLDQKPVTVSLETATEVPVNTQHLVLGQHSVTPFVLRDPNAQANRAGLL